MIDDFADVDILVTYGGPDLLARIRENPLTSRMQAVADGGVVLLGNDPAGTAATPTPMSIEWVLEEYVARLADAARTAE